MSRNCIAALLVALIVLVCGDARAQAPDDAAKTSAMKEAAKELYDEAREARKTDDFATCHAKASAAWAIHAHPSIAALIGDCAVGIKNYRDAAERLSFFFASEEAKGSESLRAHLRARLDEALTHVATVKLSISVGEASCEVDGRRVDAVPATIFLDPGEHTFEAKHPAHTTATRKETLAAGAEIKILLVLLPVPAQLEPQPEAPPKASDGTGLIVGAVVSGVVAAGGLALTIAAAVLHSNATSDIDTLNATIDSQNPRDDACTGGGAALAGPCGELSSAIDDQSTFATLFPVGYVIAGVGAAAAATFVVLYFTGDYGTEVSLTVSPTHVGLEGRF